MWRRTGLISADTNQFCGVIFDRSDHALRLRIPPFIIGDPVAVAVSAGEQRRMSGCGARVGVVIKAIGEICAMIEKEAETAFAKLIAITVQIVAPELIDDNHKDELGMTVVGRSQHGRGLAK